MKSISIQNPYGFWQEEEQGGLYLKLQRKGVFLLFEMMCL
jgi:hypothetical protein